MFIRTFSKENIIINSTSNPRTLASFFKIVSIIILKIILVFHLLSSKMTLYFNEAMTCD